MAHIHTDHNQHDFTVTAYIIRVDTPEPVALLHMHKKLGVLLPVGGHIELDETPWQAVAHELTEESGYRIDELQVLQPNSRIKRMSNVVQHPYPLSMNTHDITINHFHTDIEYGLVANFAPSLDVAADESTDLRWLTQTELHELSSKDIFDNTREVYDFMFNEALDNWERVDADVYRFEYLKPTENDIVE